MSGEAEAQDHLPPPGEEGAAVFTVSTGWCGGHGEAVLDGDGRIRTLDGLPLFLDEEGWRAIRESIDLSGTWQESPVVRVSGRVRLERRRGRNESVPGAPKERYLALCVTSLETARILGERAVDEPG